MFITNNARARVAMLFALAVCPALPQPAHAATSVRPFGAIGPFCERHGGVRLCDSTGAGSSVPSFDGVPLDVALTLPGVGDGPYPLIVQLGGWGSVKSDFRSGGALTSWSPSAEALAKRGFAVLDYTSRGFGESCGSTASRLAAPAGCARGWVRISDSRYEVRDTQHLAGLLADQGLVSPRRIGVLGVTTGAGQALALATLRERVAVASRRDSLRLVRWRSPAGKPMRIAAAVPILGYSDLPYILAPNGRTVDYLRTGSTDDPDPVGVVKAPVANGLYALGLASGAHYSPPGVDPASDLTTWLALFDAGEPYDRPAVRAVIRELARNHSASHIPMNGPPAPTLMSNGWTDEILPVDEALRYVNRVRARYPRAALAQLYLDIGHRRGLTPSIEPRDKRRLQDATAAWFDRYLRGADVKVIRGVEARPQRCPTTGAAPPRIHRARTWAGLHPSEVRLRGRRERFVTAGSGTPTPFGGAEPEPSCVSVPAAYSPGTATYRLRIARPFTLLGSPTVIADLDVDGATNGAELVARLWGVGTSETQTLVARAVYRPAPTGRQVFQLHPNGYRFRRGHQLVLELSGGDTSLFRASNMSYAVRVRGLELRVPTAGVPGCGMRRRPSRPFVPPGGEVVADSTAGADRRGGDRC